MIGRAGVACLAGLLWTSLLVVFGPASAFAQDTIELPVSFQVVNSNTSLAPCVSDGRSYTIRGHISGPESVLRGSPAPPITMISTATRAGSGTGTSSECLATTTRERWRRSATSR